MLIKSIGLKVFLACLVLCGGTGILYQTVFGDNQDTRLLVSELLRDSSVAEDIWSITVIDSPDAEQIHVRIMSKPVEGTGGVCVSRVRFHFFDDIEGAWVLESSRQGIRMTDATVGCDYSLDANSFALVSGGEIESETFLQLLNIISGEQSVLNQLGPRDVLWLDAVPSIVYDVKSSIIEIRYLSGGCMLTLNFDVDRDGRPALQEYSTSNVHCVRK